MAWVMNIREVRHVEVEIEEEQLGLRRGPVMTKVERVIVDLPTRSIAQVVGFRPMIFLPVHTGAGPCGTRARRAQNAAVLGWSIQQLMEPLRAYYATYVPPMRFGAKPGPRGRRAA